MLLNSCTKDGDIITCSGSSISINIIIINMINTFLGENLTHNMGGGAF